MNRLQNLLAVIVLAALPWPLPAAAQAAGDTPKLEETLRTTDVEIPSATVTLDGRRLFSVRGSSSIPASERAVMIADRIRQAARDAEIRPEDVRVVAEPLGDQIMAGSIRIMTVGPSDGEFESLNYNTLAASHARKIGQAISTYRAERTPEHLLRGLLISVVATVLLGAAVWFFQYGLRRLEATLERRYRARIEALPVGKAAGQELSLWRPMASGVRATRWLLRLALIFVWAEIVLSQFPWTQWIADNLDDFIIQPVVSMAAAFGDYLPKLFFLLVLFAITRYGLRLLRLYFSTIERGVSRLQNFDPEWSLPTYKIIRAIVLALALVMAYPYLPGSGTDALQGVSVFAGLLISLGASSAVSGIIAGYMNTFGRVFRVGDMIQVGEMRGIVTRTGLLATRIRTIRNEEITIPNTTIAGTSVTNFSALGRDHGIGLQAEVGIGYETPWRQVHAMLLEAATRTPGLLSEPAPFVAQRQLGDFAVVYQLNVRAKDPTRMLRTYSDLYQNVLDIFNEHAVQIMTPAYEGDPATPKIVPKDQWFAAPARPPDAQSRHQPP